MEHLQVTAYMWVMAYGCKRYLSIAFTDGFYLMLNLKNLFRNIELIKLY